MIDEIFDSNYQSGRRALNAGIDRGLVGFGRSLMAGFERLNRIQFAAPWARPARGSDIGCA